jgi:anthranilate phosphoribosyltransferase
MSNEFKKFLEPNYKISSFKEAFEAFGMIADGLVDNKDIKQFLLNINEAEENINEAEEFERSQYPIYLNGAVSAFKNRMVKVKSPYGAIDVCGTGGDGLNTLNISTAVAFVVAACNVSVAKHGNRAVSSKSGSADILSALGININLSKEKAEECLEKNNLVFLFAPLYHPAFKHVSQARRELGVKTIFNYLGPVLNPAQVKFQLIGCSNKKMVSNLIMASAFLDYSANCTVVHADDGMDEISISSDSTIFIKSPFGIVANPVETKIDPEKYGFKKVDKSFIEGKTPEYNAVKLVELLKGNKSAYYDVVVLNAALALTTSGNSFSFEFEAIKMAKEAIDSGKALKVLENLQNFK